jgi:hypothetical protein
VLLLALVGLAGAPRPTAAQETRADSAAMLLRAARLLEARGELRLARELLQVLLVRFPGTAGAVEARHVADQLGEEDSLIGLGRAGFIAYHTAFGAWLGLIIPAALDADGEAAYGAGLLIGAPLGFFGSRALARSRGLTRGQASLMQFASTWGTWQGLGWQVAADIGAEEVCEIDVCYYDGSDTAPWGMALAGGIAGLGLGLLASRMDITEGRAAVITNAGYWATWYGYLTAYLTDSSDDSALAAALLAGNIGVLIAIPVGRAWNPTAARVRTISAAGLAGALAGAGIALLVSADGDQEVAGLLAAGSSVGLVGGALLTRQHGVQEGTGIGAGEAAGALVQFRDGFHLGMPSIMLTLLPAPEGSLRYTVPGVRVGLLQMTW